MDKQYFNFLNSIYQGHLNAIAKEPDIEKWKNELFLAYEKASKSDTKETIGVWGTARDEGLAEKTKLFLSALASEGISRDFSLVTGGGNDGAMGFSMSSWEKEALKQGKIASIGHLRLLWLVEWHKEAGEKWDSTYEKQYIPQSDSSYVVEFPPFPNLLTRTAGLLGLHSAFPHPEGKARTWISVDGGNGTDLEIMTFFNENAVGRSLIRGPGERLVLFDDYEGGVSSYTSLLDHMIISFEKGRRSHPKESNILILRMADTYIEEDYKGVKLISGPAEDIAKVALG